MIIFKILLVGTSDELDCLVDLNLNQINQTEGMIIQYESITMKNISFELVRTFDLIVIDMTHHDYTSARTSKYRELSRDKLRIILVGDSTEYEQVRKIFRSGIYDYWIKPYDSVIIAETLRSIIDISLKKINLPEQKQKIIHAIEGLSVLNPFEYDLYYAHCVHPQLATELLYANIYTCILELIEPVSFEPMKLDKKKVAATCSNWIIEKDNTHNAFFMMLIYFRKIYKEIYHPNVQSKIVKKAIFEVLSPKQHLKSVKYIADTLYINQSHLSYTFKKHTGISLSEYIKQIKIYGAMWMLIQQEYTVDDIMNILDYKDEQYFSKIFKDKTGMLPSSFRKANKKYQNKD